MSPISDSHEAALAPDKLVILDRDGVINRDSDAYIKTLEEWLPYPTAISAIARLTHSGYTVAIATNQSGISRGYYGVATLHAMHERLVTLVEAQGGRIAHIAYCPHGPDDQCACRKPLPGLLLEIQQRLGIDTLEGSWMVGDSLRDLQAGEAVGCCTILVRTGKGAKTEMKSVGLEKSRVFNDLAEFTDWLCSR